MREGPVQSMSEWVRDGSVRDGAAIGIGWGRGGADPSGVTRAVPPARARPGPGCRERGARPRGVLCEVSGPGVSRPRSHKVLEGARRNQKG